MESFYVVEGEITLYIGDKAGVRGSAGSFAHRPGGAVHGFRIESERPVTSLAAQPVKASGPHDDPDSGITAAVALATASAGGTQRSPRYYRYLSEW